MSNVENVKNAQEEINVLDVKAVDFLKAWRSLCEEYISIDLTHRTCKGCEVERECSNTVFYRNDEGILSAVKKVMAWKKRQEEK